MGTGRVAMPSGRRSFAGNAIGGSFVDYCCQSRVRQVKTQMALRPCFI